MEADDLSVLHSNQGPNKQVMQEKKSRGRTSVNVAQLLHLFL